MKPKRVKTGGRQKHPEELVPTFTRLTHQQRKLLRMWGRGDLTAGLRWLIDTASQMIRKADKT